MGKVPLVLQIRDYARIAVITLIQITNCIGLLNGMYRRKHRIHATPYSPVFARRSPQHKKHKTWDGDGVLVIRGSTHFKLLDQSGVTCEVNCVFVDAKLNDSIADLLQVYQILSRLNSKVVHALNLPRRKFIWIFPSLVRSSYLGDTALPFILEMWILLPCGHLRLPSNNSFHQSDFVHPRVLPMFRRN